MIQEHLDAIKAQKTEHAEEVIAKIAELEALINSRPDIWFGGLPPVFVGLSNNTKFAEMQIKEVFDID